MTEENVQTNKSWQKGYGDSDNQSKWTTPFGRVQKCVTEKHCLVWWMWISAKVADGRVTIWGQEYKPIEPTCLKSIVQAAAGVKNQKSCQTSFMNMTLSLLNFSELEQNP